MEIPVAETVLPQRPKIAHVRGVQRRALPTAHGREARARNRETSERPRKCEQRQLPTLQEKSSANKPQREDRSRYPQQRHRSSGSPSRPSGLQNRPREEMMRSRGSTRKRRVQAAPPPSQSIWSFLFGNTAASGNAQVNSHGIRRQASLRSRPEIWRGKVVHCDAALGAQKAKRTGVEMHKTNTPKSEASALDVHNGLHIPPQHRFVDPRFTTQNSGKWGEALISTCRRGFVALLQDVGTAHVAATSEAPHPRGFSTPTSAPSREVRGRAAAAHGNYTAKHHQIDLDRSRKVFPAANSGPRKPASLSAGMRGLSPSPSRRPSPQRQPFHSTKEPLGAEAINRNCSDPVDTRLTVRPGKDVDPAPYKEQHIPLIRKPVPNLSSVNEIVQTQEQDKRIPGSIPMRNPQLAPLLLAATQRRLASKAQHAAKKRPAPIPLQSANANYTNFASRPSQPVPGHCPTCGRLLAIAHANSVRTLCQTCRRLGYSLDHVSKTPVMAPSRYHEIPTYAPPVPPQNNCLGSNPPNVLVSSDECVIHPALRRPRLASDSVEDDGQDPASKSRLMLPMRAVAVARAPRPATAASAWTVDWGVASPPPEQGKPSELVHQVPPLPPLNASSSTQWKERNPLPALQKPLDSPTSVYSRTTNLQTLPRNKTIVHRWLLHTETPLIKAMSPPAIEMATGAEIQNFASTMNAANTGQLLSNDAYVPLREMWRE